MKLNIDKLSAEAKEYVVIELEVEEKKSDVCIFFHNVHAFKIRLTSFGVLVYLLTCNFSYGMFGNIET